MVIEVKVKRTIGMKAQWTTTHGVFKGTKAEGGDGTFSIANLLLMKFDTGEGYEVSMHEILRKIGKLHMQQIKLKKSKKGVK